MRQPSPTGTTVDTVRKRTWRDRFLHYRYPPSIDEISEFIAQFGSAHEDVAARLLDSVEVITRTQIEQAFRTLMENLPGWHRAKRRGRTPADRDDERGTERADPANRSPCR